MSTEIQIPQAYLDAGHILAHLQDGKLRIVQGYHRAQHALGAGMKARIKQLDDVFWKVEFVVHRPARPRSKGAQRLRLEAEIAQRSGCIDLRRSRATGTMVGLYRSAEAQLEDDPSCAYTTVCEDHGTLVGHLTLADARSHLAHPDMWCDYCREKES